MLNNDIQNLNAILEGIIKIERYISTLKNVDDFYESTLNFDAVMMNFIIIGEMVERLSEGFKKNHDNIDWQKIKGFRNIVAHDYFGIDADEVWQIIKTHLITFKNDIQSILGNI